MTSSKSPGELVAFLWHRKVFWMIPLVSILLIFGLLIVVGSAAGVGPFIHTLFWGYVSTASAMMFERPQRRVPV